MLGIEGLMAFGIDSMGYLGLIIIQWIIIFILNVVPALAPPTWAILSFFYISFPQDIFILILIGVTASTCGRFVLAKVSGVVTEKFASRKKKKEFDEINNKLQKKPMQKFIFTLLYALSPLPSNALFIAFGATKTRLREVLVGFFVGRTISYLFLVFTTQKVFSSLETTLAGNASLWTIMIEIIGVIAVIGFFFVDWNKIILMEPKAPVQHKWPKRNKPHKY